MNTTKILGEAVGIQRQDIIDRTEEQTADGLTGAVILGRFKRGRVDAPMEIHQGNIRGQLGYDPKNPDYIAVQDCLDTNVPSVQVLRVKGGDIDPEIPTEPEITYRLTIDDKGLLPEDNIYSGTIEPPLIGAVLSFNIQQYLPNGSNGRVFNIYSDPQGLVVSPDGATWKVDKSIVAPYWDFPTSSNFITPAEYSLTLHKFLGDETLIDANLKYTVVTPVEPEPFGVTDFQFYSSGNRNLGRFQTLDFGLNGFPIDEVIPWRIQASFNFYSLNLRGYVSDLIAAYNNGMGVFTLDEYSFGLPPVELTESSIRNIFQLSVQDGENSFNYRGHRAGVFVAGGQGMQDSFSITPHTPLKPWIP